MRVGRWLAGLILSALLVVGCGSNADTGHRQDEVKLLARLEMGSGWTVVRVRETSDQGGKYTEKVSRAPNAKSWGAFLGSVRASKPDDLISAFKRDVGNDDFQPTSLLSTVLDQQNCWLSLSLGVDHWGSGVAAYARAHCS